MERFIAIDNVCAWPNLTLVPDSVIIATIFNQPCHGLWEGDVECWASRDGGYLWQRCGIPAPHEPGTNRMNVAAGLAHDGALIVIASGWSDRKAPGIETPHSQAHILSPWVCRSMDGGRSWERAGVVIFPHKSHPLVPFGDIVRAPDGTLVASFYGSAEAGRSDAYLFHSRDDGRTWGEPTLIAADDYNETALLRLKNDCWLAACRTRKDQHLALFASSDSQNWIHAGPLTLPGQHPGHLLELADGRILLVYGIRNPGLYGIGARLSGDSGTTWGAPILLADLEDATDGGYPASVQLHDGTIVTAYYANRIPSHQRYHMGVLRWKA